MWECPQKLGEGIVIIMKDVDMKKNFIIFGAGKKGKECYAFLKKNNKQTVFFVDNDIAKWGESIDGLPIRQPVDIKKADPESTIIVIACAGREQEIEHQMMDMGIYIKYNCIRLLDLYIREIQPYYLEQDKILQNDDLDIGGSGELLYDFQIFAEQKNGGISRYFHEIISRIATRCSVELFEGFNNNDNSLFSDNKLLNRYYMRDYEGNKECRNILNSSLFYSFVKKRKYKIYHPTYYHDYGVDCYKACIITVHDMIHELYMQNQKMIIEKKNMISKADGIIAVSENTKKDLINIYNVDEKKIKVVYHANSLSVNVTSPRMIKEPYILYVGKRNGYKNAKILLQAFARCRHMNDLKIIFFSPEGFSDKEKQFFSVLKLERHIEHISGSDVVLANLYKYAEIFVYPSLYEGFGIPILEAMHYGTPVISSNSSSLPEVGGNAAAYFTPDSADDLAECMDKILDDEERRVRMGQAGMLREKMFSWDKSAEEHMKYYRQFLS